MPAMTHRLLSLKGKHGVELLGEVPLARIVGFMLCSTGGLASSTLDAQKAAGIILAWVWQTCTSAACVSFRTATCCAVQR